MAQPIALGHGIVNHVHNHVQLSHEGPVMKKTSITGALITGAMAGALVAGSALAADLPPANAPIMRAMAPVFSWTGCYLGGGFGYSMWNQDTFSETGGVAVSATATSGGRGWLGTATLGCDYQVNSSIVIGAYGDWDFGDIKGQFAPGGATVVGNESEKWAWGAGGRIGWLVTPTVLTYFSGGYTQAHFDPVTFNSAFPPFGPAGLSMDAHTYNGWFLGSGFDYAISILPSGFFLRSEYRYSTYQAADLPLLITGPGNFGNQSINSKKFVQTIRSELTYRFNWGH
jgi:outer membrane immunogenic protein